MSFVLDANTCLAWVLPDEVQGDAAKKAKELLRQSRATVPCVWALEIASVLLKAERRKRLKPNHGATFMRQLLSLPIQVAAESAELSRGWAQATFDLAHAQQLSSYDASYLLLAIRRSLPLASDDGSVRRVAIALNVPLIDQQVGA